MQGTRTTSRRPLIVALTTTALTALGLVVPAVQPAQAAGSTGPIVGPGGKCLDDPGAVITNGTAMKLWACNGTDAQKWTVGSDRTVRVFGTKCLDSQTSLNPGTPAIIWDCNGTRSQEWTTGPNGSLVALGSTLCLDNANGVVQDGNPIVLWHCNGTGSQTWTLPGSSTVTTPLAVNAIGAQSATQGVATGFRPTATGGTGQHQWTASGLPAGMSMNYINGTIQGAPTATGSSTVTVTVTDATGATATRNFTWNVAAATTAAKYYLDCNAATNGNGTDTPWNSLASANSRVFQPGESLLLKKGSTCNGQLAPKGNGSATAPITLGSYGTGTAKPVVNGNGISDGGSNPTISDSTVRLTNQSHWIIENLEVTNDATEEARRSGINVYITDGQPHAGITIRNNTVHHVKGWTTRNLPEISEDEYNALTAAQKKERDDTNSRLLNNFYLSHGIGVDSPVNGGYLTGLTIVDNTVRDMSGVGIGIYGDQAHGNANAVRHQYTHVLRNTVRDVSNDAVVVSVSDSPLVEYNTADRLGAVGYGVIAGIWGWGDTNPTFQYNEVSNIVRVSDDSTAWDCDGEITGTCTYQYNYSRDNNGGIITQCTGCGGNQATRIVFRYNIAVNDCRIHQVKSSGYLAAFQFYNNVIDCRGRDFTFEPTLKNVQMTNNVFLGKAGATLNPSFLYRNNTYLGFTPPASDPQASTTSPNFVALPAATSSGVTAPVGIANLGGYRLQAGSPALGSGTPVTGQFGRDLWGNSAPVTATPNRGAYTGTGQ
ncbi:ricin-type beta-trefoil lectin domain protein [Kitasatospora sp. NPDC096147]|uniref:ricin-type beta-trefoil lectin domain protein n=1 Tax=Kitasatospora sp. NPDC096147 TaxID=3364093 RepID=UPI00382A4179